MRIRVLDVAGVVLAAAAAASVAFAPACGGDDISFGHDDNDSPTKVTFTGNLDDIDPVTTRDIVVFVYNINGDGDNHCPCPPNPSGNNVGKAAVIGQNETEFTISDLEPGSFGVVFLLDNPGNLADGEIDPGDPIAVLDDIDCQLNDIDGKITVTLTDIDLQFENSPIPPGSTTTTTLSSDSCKEGSPPASGRARADLIRKQTTVTTN